MEKTISYFKIVLSQVMLMDKANTIGNILTIDNNGHPVPIPGLTLETEEKVNAIY